MSDSAFGLWDLGLPFGVVLIVLFWMVAAQFVPRKKRSQERNEDAGPHDEQ